MLEVAIRKVQFGHKGMHVVSNNTQADCGVWTKLSWY